MKNKATCDRMILESEVLELEENINVDYKSNIIKNMVALRKAFSYTQGELSNIVNYSDKAISKWERGESTPDVIALKKMADLYGVSVDYFFEDHTNEKIDTDKDKNKLTSKHLLITAITLSGVAILATIAFVLCLIINGVVGSAWLIYVAIMPVEFILLLIFNMIWGRKKYNKYLSSCILWTVLCLVYLILLKYNYWYLFIIGVPVQVVLLLVHRFTKKK